MSRRSNLTALLGAPIKPEEDKARNSEATADASPELSPDKPSSNAPVVARSGAARSMGAIWKATAARADAAQGVSQGAVTELDTSLLDASFVADRVADSSDPSFAAFVENVREHGQQIPILVRQLPGERYQIAYGHRRARAAKALGRPVRAVVRTLTDAELVLAQASENLARRDLSYIERAFFAANMADAGISREVIEGAMGADDAQISRYIKVARSIPPDILAAIGPAPKVGRPRWDELAERLKIADLRRARETVGEPSFADRPTDERFALVFAALAEKAVVKSGRARVWKDGSGRKIARIEQTATRFTLSIDRKLEPELGEFLVGRLDEILTALRAGKEEPDLKRQPKGDETPE